MNSEMSTYDRWKSNVVMKNVVDTEDLKQKHALERRASAGMLRHLINMDLRQRITLILIW